MFSRKQFREKDIREKCFREFITASLRGMKSTSFIVLVIRSKQNKTFFFNLYFSWYMFITLVIGKLPPRRDRDTNPGPLSMVVADISKALGTD